MQSAPQGKRRSDGLFKHVTKAELVSFRMLPDSGNKTASPTASTKTHVAETS